MSLDETLIRAFHAHLAAGDLTHRDASAAHEIFQTSTINALLESVYDGDVTFAELARHGDLGLGTFDALDGEMTALDGEFFQARSDGSVRRASPDMRTPFAVMIPFDPTLDVVIAEPADYAGLMQALDAAAPSTNLFYALRADGRFDWIKLRAVPRQEKPYPPLVEVTADQPEFEHRGIEGSLPLPERRPPRRRPRAGLHDGRAAGTDRRDVPVPPLRAPGARLPRGRPRQGQRRGHPQGRDLRPGRSMISKEARLASRFPLIWLWQGTVRAPRLKV
jgi:acetolactate decarboxylase